MAATLTSIDTAVSLLTNKVNSLVEIFTAGGVSNPDLAALKADIQSDYNTKLANYAKLSGTVTFTGNVYASNFYITNNVNSLESMDWTRAYYWALTNKDNRNVSLTDILCYVNNGSSSGFGSTGIEFRIFPNNIYGNSGETINMGMSYRPQTGISYGYAPKYLNDLSDNSNKIVTTAFLNATGNSVVHKTGDETIDGDKTFTGRILAKSFRYEDTITNAVIPSADHYIYGLEIRSSDDVRMARDHIVIRKDTGTMQRWFALFSNGETHNEFSLSMYALSAGRAEGINYVPNDEVAYMLSDCAFVSKGYVLPYSDNKFDLGMEGRRWRNFYCASGTFNTSDERIKDNIDEIPEAVFRAWAKVNFCQYKFKEAIAEKGEKARLHIGLIAQRVIEAFQSEGLDATVYGIIGHKSWKATSYTETESVSDPVYEDVEVVVPATYTTKIDAETGEERKVIDQDERRYIEHRLVKDAEVKERVVNEPAGEIYMLRYDECLALECAYQRYVLNQIKAKLGM